MTPRTESVHTESQYSSRAKSTHSLALKLQKILTVGNREKSGEGGGDAPPTWGGRAAAGSSFDARQYARDCSSRNSDGASGAGYPRTNVVASARYVCVFLCGIGLICKCMCMCIFTCGVYV